MIAAPVHLLGERLMLCPSGALHWPAERTLVVADLHLEKGSAFASRGAMLPPYDTRETLQRLSLAIRRHGAKRLVLLGDSFHDGAAAGRMAPEDRSALERLCAGLEECIWVSGNHDAEHGVAEWRRRKLVFRHIASDVARSEAELSGHFHPKATMPTRIGGITRPCFLLCANRLVLPAFGAFTGGLNVLDPAMAGIARNAVRVFLIGDARLHSAPFDALRRAAA
ncbi:ligase-associated DNA damage response endonuclease PdeM [Sabulicella rubraurantiaca]|uniref:ligase-associated DNA damage response endonuclease PdeM n=1 Tax=Sabulicella rubraurantiaca TaxID=2811429 RepID=UPI001A979A02|nr:ligase-associated DNA damage response endonuclease PdeM [Sabulicella rubraurantiaca]